MSLFRLLLLSYVLKSLFEISNVPIFYTVYCVIVAKVILLKLHLYFFLKANLLDGM